MFFYAQTNVSNEVIAVSQVSGEIIDPHMISISSYDESLLGKVWDGTTFNAVVVNPPIVNNNLISKIQFIHLFTDPELVNILTAAKTDVYIELLVTKTKLSDHMDLLDPILIAAINYLEQHNLIGVGRAAQVLANIPQQ